MTGPQNRSAVEHTSGMAGLSAIVRRPTAPASLDTIDRALLRELATDSRVSQRELGRRIGMSPPAVADRIGRLEEAGVIVSYGAAVDWAAIGVPMLVHVSITVAPGAELRQLLAELSALDELEDLHFVTGENDLVGRFRLRDHAHMQDLLLDRLWPIHGIQRVETLVSLGQIPVGSSLRAALTHEEGES